MRRLQPLLRPLALLAAGLLGLLALLGLRRRREAGLPPPRPREERLGWLGTITQISLQRRSVVFLAAAIVALLGVFSALDIRQELFPEIDLPAVTVVTRFPGASPDAIAEEVTKPIETSISNVEGLRRLQSTTVEGVSVVVAEFDFGTDTEAKERQIASALDRLDLPAGVERPSVNRIDFGDFPIVALTLYGEASLEELERVARETVVPALQRIDGVFTVSVSGAEEPRLLISLDPARMAEQGVTILDITKTLSGSGVSLPSGFALEEERMLPVRTVQEVESVEELAALPIVRSSRPPAGSEAPLVRLGDVADVEVAPSPTAAVARTNGQPSLALGVFKTREANTVEVANQVEDTLEEIQPLLPEGVKTAVLFDQSILIEESIASLIREGLFGALFAVIVILVFLTSVRATIVTAISIPLSMLAAIAVLNWQGSP